MSEDLDFLMEKKIHKKGKNFLWKLEPYFSKILFFFAIIQFFLDNFILRLDYVALFSDVGDWLDVIFVLILIGTVLGVIVVLPIYFYIKFIHNKLGPKSAIANELYLSLFLLVINFVLNNLRSIEFYIYIFVLSTFAISIIGSVFLYSPTEKTISLISQAVDPITAFEIYNNLITNRLKNILDLSNKIEKKILIILKDIDQNPDNSNKKVFDYLEEKKKILEDYLILNGQRIQITSKFNESKEFYLNNRDVKITVEDCKEELKLRSLINKESGEFSFCFIGGFFLCMLGIMGIIYHLLNLPINLPLWIALILIFLSIFLWFYGYRLRNKRNEKEKKFELLLAKYNVNKSVP